MANPKPVPPNLLVVEESACSKELNTRPCLSGAIPIPVSLTMINSCLSSPFNSVRISTCPSLVNFTALPAKLNKIWRSRAQSPVNSVLFGTSFSTISSMLFHQLTVVWRCKPELRLAQDETGPLPVLAYFPQL